MENQQGRDKEFCLNSENLKNGHLDWLSDFIKYLEKTGTLDKITEIFMDLYEQPESDIPVLEYTRKRLTDTNPDDEELAKLRPALEDAKRFKDYLEKENQRLWTKLNETQYDSIDEEEAETVE